MRNWGKRRAAYATLLIVGEGESEVAFLQHIKALCVSRGAGLKVTVTCVFGKGAAHVVDVAIRKSADRAYDNVAMLLDTDTGWTPQIEKLAQKNGIHVLTSVPMFEAMMLRIHGQYAEGASGELKRRFQDLIQASGLERAHYAGRFGDAVLQRARATESTIDRLLRLLHTEPLQE